MVTEDRNRPASWGETLLALGPILLFTVFYVFGAFIAQFLDDPNNPSLGFGLMGALVSALLIALLAGWVKNFPRWVFPYWGFAFLIAFYFYSFSGTVFGRPFTGDMRVWMPLGLVVLAGLLWSRSLHPLRSLFQSIWQDWTLLSFAFYGALPLLSFAAYDEARNQAWMQILILLIFGIGIVLYMRFENPWHRFASLVGSLSIGWMSLIISLSWYWNGRQEYWMPEPGSWVETFIWTSRYGAIVMVVLVAPVLIELLRLSLTAKRVPPALHKPNGD